jgi:hypothetical protein
MSSRPLFDLSIRSQMTKLTNMGKKGFITAIILIIATVTIFFLPLFYPAPKIIVTPDFGTSDAWDASFADKAIMSRSLKMNEIPLWSALIGDGQPVLGNAYGVFYPPNLILFRFFDTVTAGNLLIVFSVILFATGMFILAGSLELSPPAALFTALSLAFSGIVIPRLTHLMIIPALSLIPWVFWGTLKLAKKQSVANIIMLSVIIA